MTTLTFPYDGASHDVIVPADVTEIIAILNGAEGDSTAGGAGGRGGRVQVRIPVSPAQVLRLTPGGSGLVSGFNGGGAGAGRGGGASDIRTGGTTLAHRIAVAAGGGGASTLSDGGDGGAATGEDGEAGPDFSDTYLNIVLADNPYLLWPLDETSGTNADDASGNNRDGTYAGSPTLGQAGGPPGGLAMQFDGTDDAVARILGGTVLLYAVECWLYLPGVINAGDLARAIIVGYTVAGAGGVPRWFTFAGESSGSLSGETLTWVDQNGSVTVLSADTSAGSIPAGWHHFVATYRASNGRVELFLDGPQVSDTYLLSGGPDSITAIIAGLTHLNGSPLPNGARMQWLAAYTDELSDARVLAHYDGAFDRGGPGGGGGSQAAGGSSSGDGEAGALGLGGDSSGDPGGGGGGYYGGGSGVSSEGDGGPGGGGGGSNYVGSLTTLANVRGSRSGDGEIVLLFTESGGGSDEGCGPTGPSRRLVRSGVIDGPIFHDLGEAFPSCYTQGVRFQVASELPWLLADPLIILDPVELTGPVCADAALTADWPGDAGLIVTITSGAGPMDGVLLTAVALQEGESDPTLRPPFLTATVRDLPPGRQIIFDSATRQITEVEPSSGRVVGTVEHLDFGGPLRWLEVPPCGNVWVCFDPDAATLSDGHSVAVQQVNREL